MWRVHGSSDVGNLAKAAAVLGRVCLLACVCKRGHRPGQLRLIKPSKLRLIWRLTAWLRTEATQREDEQHSCTRWQKNATGHLAVWIFFFFFFGNAVNNLLEIGADISHIYRQHLNASWTFTGGLGQHVCVFPIVTATCDWGQFVANRRPDQADRGVWFSAVKRFD